MTKKYAVHTVCEIVGEKSMQIQMNLHSSCEYPIGRKYSLQKECISCRKKVFPVQRKYSLYKESIPCRKKVFPVDRMYFRSLDLFTWSCPLCVCLKDL